MGPFLYLDPGTGSLLLYALIGAATTLFFLFRGLWYRFRGRLFKGAKGHDLDKDLPALVFHSEGKKYWQVFQPVLQALNDKKILFAYVSADEEEIKLASAYPTAVTIHPGNEMATLAYMNRINADYVVTTTPHLDIYMLKRSKHVKKYIYLFHAPTSLDFYEKYAFNRYDVLLCPGQFVEKAVRELEAMRNLPAKELHFTGCTYFDFMLNEQKETESTGKSKESKTILYAPTWGSRSSILRYGPGILKTLAAAGYDVIFRPHPQFYVSHKTEIGEVEKLIEETPNISLDRNITGTESMTKADLMISDISGVLFDFAYLYEKPIILVDVPLSLAGQEGEGLSECWEKNMCERLSRVLKAEEIESLPEIADSLLQHSADLSREIRKLRDSELTAFGRSGELTAETLIRITEETK